MERFVVVGAAPVGTGTARALVAQGGCVDIVSRSGDGPTQTGITLHAVDANDRAALRAVAAGARAIINAANPPYTKWETLWPPLAQSLLATAAKTGATLVTMSNLYGHGPRHQTMRADTPLDATGRKGRTRARMWNDALEAHNSGRVKVAEVRASDFFGPGVRDANTGERVISRILSKKSAQLLGRDDVPHSFSYMPDVVRTLACVATNPDSWGRALVVPSISVTQKEMVRALCNAAGVPEVKVSTVPTFVLSVAGVLVPMMRELKEISYQFDAPFVVDATETTTHLGVVATPLPQAASDTIAWWRDPSRRQVAGSSAS